MRTKVPPFFLILRAWLIPKNKQTRSAIIFNALLADAYILVGDFGSLIIFIGNSPGKHGLWWKFTNFKCALSRDRGVFNSVHYHRRTIYSSPASEATRSGLWRWDIPGPVDNYFRCFGCHRAYCLRLGCQTSFCRPWVCILLRSEHGYIHTHHSSLNWRETKNLTR